MEKIKSITEAFSMQPCCKSVTSTEDYEKWKSTNPAGRDGDIKEIKLETVQIGRKYGEPIEDLYYCGYNFEGKKLFQYLALTVNVDFF